ncbi:MAG: hypothetical protein KJO64_06955, partial [Bacteroidia bacterium]|nr:hypothetical protein [Bacteroidia bacterium]
MKKAAIIFFVFFSGLVYSGNAFHIVGGDFQYEWVSGNNFKITLKLFRDCSGTGAGFDGTIRVGIYDRLTNNLQSEFFMDLDSIGDLSLAGSLCSPPPSVCVELGTYVETVSIPNNPNGYYLIWERCCRNSVVQNINIPDQTGMAFYLEMPNPALQNSSPYFLNDPLPYMCQGQPFIYNFEGQDPDGDSLVYSLSTPKAGGHTSTIYPNGTGTDPTMPAPYVDVVWRAPYTLGNLAGGIPVSVNNNSGAITAIPNTVGIFAMAMDVKEFRNGVQIGLIRREIQFSVIACIDNATPVITNNAVNAVYNLLPGDTLDIIVDAQDYDPQDSLFLSVSGNNLPGSGIAPPFAFAQNDSGIAAASTQVFWAPTCDHISATPYKMTFVAKDNGCPQNLFKVGTITINVGGFQFPKQINIECAEVLKEDLGVLYLKDLPSQTVPKLNYFLYRNVNGGAFNIVDTISQLGASIAYLDSNGVDFSANSYCYFIQGFNVCDAPGLSSDTVCISGPVPPELYINTVTVVNDDYVELNWDFVSGVDKQEIKIYRKSTQFDTGYRLYKTITDSTITLLNDHNTNVHQYQYCYSIIQNLPCGKIVNQSNESCSILLSGESYPMRHLLNWTKYVSWKGGVSDYEIYRTDGAGGTPV